MLNIQSLNPYTGKVQFQTDFISEDAVNQCLSNSWNAYSSQADLSLSQRLYVIEAVKGLLNRDQSSLAALMTQEMGKPIQESMAEIEKCILVCDFYCQHAPNWLESRVISTEPKVSRVDYTAMGIILGIMPWNFPFWQVFRLAIPTILVGNVVLLKHAPNVPLCALRIEALFIEAGALPGTYQNIFASEDQIASILTDHRIKGVSLTGSEKAGRAVASAAGKQLKKQVLELGGSDPFLVMPTANIQEAAHCAVKSRLINNGQSCIAAKRFIIHEDVYELFLAALKSELSRLKIGDPSDPAVHIGPLARLDLVEQLKHQVDLSIQKGAVVEAQYEIAIPHANFAPITVLSNISKGMPAYEEELFGPVFSLFKVSSMSEAIAIANDTAYGLGASVWTNDKSEQALAVKEIEAGSVFVNAMVRSDPSLPFGGIKNSGYGRELSEEGLKEFCNVKTIVGI